MEKNYNAIFFRQRASAPLQVAFVAPSSEIAAWSRVPTKKAANIRNFQRAEIPTHVKEVSQFFADDHNSSPTAVVVGFDPNRAIGHVALLEADGRTPLVDEAVLPGEPCMGLFRVEWGDDLDPETSEQLVGAIRSRGDLLQRVLFAELADVTRLSPDRLRELATSVGELLAREGAGALAGIPEEDGEDDADDLSADDLPPTLRSHLSGLSPSERQVVLGRLVFLAQATSPSLSSLPPDDLRKLYNEVSDECKPGLLIDGQHRVQGTKLLGRIPFLVTAIPHGAWPELAFQFIVTNRTARRVPESLLISIVGSSLSREQRAGIEERLRESGIRVGLIEAVMRVHEDESSPFYGTLAFGIDNEPGFIDAAAMRGKVIQLWFERKKPVEQLFDHFCQGRRRVDRTEYWKDEELWFTLFIAFWSAVRARYEGSAVFSHELDTEGKPVSRLMTATVLKIFQETTLDYLERYLRNKQNTEGVAISDSLPTPERFTDLVKNTLVPLTPEFFTEWQLTGFDGSKGARDDLADAIQKVISKDSTVARLKGGRQPHRLFRAPNEIATSR